MTGLSRAGKTVFISALVHNLVHGGRLPLFEAQKSGRIARAFLEQQPDDAVPRFQYEDHVAALVESRIWPEFDAGHLRARLTIELRIGLRLEPAVLGRAACRSTSSTIPANGCSTCRCSARTSADFSSEALELAAPAGARRPVGAVPGRDRGGGRRGRRPTRCWRASSPSAFTAYLKACKQDERALSTLPPGRFLMPGDLEGSPALTFAPLAGPSDGRARPGSLPP